MLLAFFQCCLFKSKHKDTKWAEKYSYFHTPPPSLPPPPTFSPPSRPPRRQGPVHYSPFMAAMVFPPKLDYARRAEMRAFWSTSQYGGDDYCIVRDREWCAELEGYSDPILNAWAGIITDDMDPVRRVISGNSHDDGGLDAISGLVDFSASSFFHYDACDRSGSSASGAGGTGGSDATTTSWVRRNIVLKGKRIFKSGGDASRKRRISWSWI